MTNNMGKTVGDAFYLIHSDSITNFVSADTIKTEEELKKYNNKGYAIDYTAKELQDILPDVNIANIYYNNGFIKAYYFDKREYILFPIQSFTANDTMRSNEDIITLINNQREWIQNDKFDCVILHLSERLRMEYLHILIADNISNVYNLFKYFFSYSEHGYGSTALTSSDIKKLINLKTDKEKKETTKQLNDEVIIYRGVGDKSTPLNQAYSWTLDINVAYFFAYYYSNDNCKIYKAKVDKEKIIEYFAEEKECFVLPEDVHLMENETIQLYGYKFLNEMLDSILDLFQSFKCILTNKIKFAMETNQHDKLHSARVLLMCLILGKLYDLDEEELIILGTASLYHESGRTNECIDKDHGKGSASKYKNDKIFDYHPVVEFLIEYHCLPDEKGYKKIEKSFTSNKDSIILLYKIFKDADALDRIRFGKQELDVKYLRLEESRNLPLVAMLCYKNLRL